MRNHDRWKKRPVLEGLEGRLPPASLTPGGAPNGDGYHQDNGSWEPKPIGNSSTRPTIPTGPTGPVRWTGNDNGGPTHDNYGGPP